MTHGTKPKLLMVFLPHSLFIAAEMGVPPIAPPASIFGKQYGFLDLA